MSRLVIVREAPVIRTARVMQAEGIFDFPVSSQSRETWNVDFELPESWNVGLIVGPSGAGKTTVTQELFPNKIQKAYSWDENKSILDGFPVGMSIKEIIELLSSVGFSSPPSWLRPYRVLSNGEKFRVDIARTLAEQPDLAVVDEFTSVVDRTVAQIGAAAVQKAIRRRNQKFVAVSCHYDVIDWLEPDWVYQPHTGQFYSGRYLHQRPKIELQIRRVGKDAWEMFRKYHYLNTNLNPSAICFLATWNDIPVAFTGILHFPHPTVKGVKREHRTVCLPDYQGVGIGNAMSDYIGSLCSGMGYRFTSTTGNPAMIRSRNNSRNWRMTQVPRMNSAGVHTAMLSGTFANHRYTAAFEYIGPSLSKIEAEKIWNS